MTYFENSYQTWTHKRDPITKDSFNSHWWFWFSLVFSFSHLKQDLQISLLFAAKQIQTTCFKDIEFMTRTGKAPCSPLLFSNHHPSASFSLPLLSPCMSDLPSHLRFFASINVCFLSHLSDFICLSKASIPQQCNDRFNSAWSVWWEIEFLLGAHYVTYWPSVSVKNKSNWEGAKEKQNSWYLPECLHGGMSRRLFWFPVMLKMMEKDKEKFCKEGEGKQKCGITVTTTTAQK